jgi:hypothetical protein
MAGYSKTPLPKKLGIKPDSVVAVVNPPSDFLATLGETPAGVTLVEVGIESAEFDVILFFTHSRSELADRFQALGERLRPAGGFWIGWPKKASKVETDLTEDIVREIGLSAGLVDNKVCAIDEVWSGLRFVIRLRDRPKKISRHDRESR